MKERGFQADDDDDKCLIGVVTGCYVGVANNFGTLLTPELMQWTVDKLTANLHLAGSNATGQ